MRAAVRLSCGIDEPSERFSPIFGQVKYASAYDLPNDEFNMGYHARSLTGHRPVESH
jgi:hypothetical protein